jgi:uncharacterized protein YheU (UPF0270 family)
MDIPVDELNTDLLKAIIQEFVTREGTDYGDSDYSLDQKVEQVRSLLRSNRAKIVFDPETETCTIVPAT